VLRGARQVIPESSAFEPEEFLDLCEHHPGCSAFLAPTMVARLVQTGRACPRNLRTVVYGGGPMYVDSLKRRWQRSARSSSSCTGEVVVAFIVGSASATELDAHMLERIARFKRPKRYEFIDELPKNSYGKVLKRELRARLV
jgi:acyl-CoA synthetase (AMP-forming)/AMP-acid ligase II